MRDPKSRREWQEAVDAAAAARALADCKMYGLIAGGPEVNVARCDDILEGGARRGILPSKPVMELAIELAIELQAAINDGVAT